MRTIKYIVLHCTAGSQKQKVPDLIAYWKNHLGWKSPGYHHVIEADGTVHDLQPIEKPSNGVAGYNENSIHISYFGGVDAKGKPVDNRTEAQKEKQIALIAKYKTKFPNAVVLGHRDFSRDQNGNGIIEQWEWIKFCPCFDVREWMREINLEGNTRPSGIVYKLNKPLIYDTNVGLIQVALNYLKVRNANGKRITEDNYFGAETDFAVRALQRVKGLPITGIVDNATQKELGITL